jgi:hypothetical protein
VNATSTGTGKLIKSGQKRLGSNGSKERAILL